MLEINKKNKFQVIEQYFKNELDDDAKKIFDQKYETEPAFREEVEKYRLVSQTFRNLTDDAVSRIEKILIEEQEVSQQPKRMVPIWKNKTYLAVAASLALIIVSGIVFFANYHQQPDEFAESKVMNQFNKEIIPGENLGFAESPDKFSETINVQIIENENYQNHYQFVNDTLKLYLGVTVSSENITIKKRAQDYSLNLNGELYELDRGFNTIRPLLKEN